ncbi:MAG: putative ABC transporter permease subunit, partial [Gemmataceae bacterium]
QVLIACLIALALALIWWIYRLARASPSELWRDEMREAVTRLLSYFQFTRNPLAPSHWVSLGLRRAVRGEVGASLYYLALIWSNGLFLYLIVAAASVRLYRRGYNRLTTGGDLRGKRAGSASDGAASVACASGSPHSVPQFSNIAPAQTSGFDTGGSSRLFPIVSPRRPVYTCPTS